MCRPRGMVEWARVRTTSSAAPTTKEGPSVACEGAIGSEECKNLFKHRPYFGLDDGFGPVAGLVGNGGEDGSDDGSDRCSTSDTLVLLTSDSSNWSSENLWSLEMLKTYSNPILIRPVIPRRIFHETFTFHKTMMGSSVHATSEKIEKAAKSLGQYNCL